MKNILELRLASQLDVSASRQRTRQIAAACGFGPHEQTRLATTVSEIARAAVDRRTPGLVAFSLETAGTRQALLITFVTALADDADGVPGLAAARRFMDRVDVDPSDSRIVLHKACPAAGGLLNAASIELGVGMLALRGDVGLSQAQQRNRDLEIENDSIALLNGQLNTRAASLASADRRKDEFLALLAHELRGPLSALAMAGAALEKQPADPQRTLQLGQVVARQTAHMSRLVEDLLDVARIVRNEVAIERNALDVRDVVGAAVEQLAAAAARRRHRVQVRLPAQAVTVQGDRTRLIQVVGNLVANAIRYTPEGGCIEVALAARGGQACVSVLDNGIGIAAALLPHLFDLFVQAERSADSRNSGLGLGLALVKTLVEAHGGSVTAHSDGAGLGSRFEFCLALTRPVPRAVPVGAP